MKFSIIINPIDENSNAMAHARQFIQAVLKKKLTVSSVFAYGYAIEMITSQHLQQQNTWGKFAESGIELLACSTIADETLTKDQKLHPCFKLSGLGQLMESLHQSEKHIEFK